MSSPSHRGRLWILLASSTLDVIAGELLAHNPTLVQAKKAGYKLGNYRNTPRALDRLYQTDLGLKSDPWPATGLEAASAAETILYFSYYKPKWCTRKDKSRFVGKIAPSASKRQFQPSLFSPEGLKLCNQEGTKFKFSLKNQIAKGYHEVHPDHFRQ